MCRHVNRVVSVPQIFAHIFYIHPNVDMCIIKLGPVLLTLHPSTPRVHSSTYNPPLQHFAYSQKNHTVRVPLPLQLAKKKSRLPYLIFCFYIKRAVLHESQRHVYSAQALCVMSESESPSSGDGESGRSEFASVVLRNVLAVSCGAMYGVLIRMAVGNFFEGRVIDSVTVTSRTSALFVDLPANALGCFVYGVIYAVRKHGSNVAEHVGKGVTVGFAGSMTSTLESCLARL